MMVRRRCPSILLLVLLVLCIDLMHGAKLIIMPAHAQATVGNGSAITPSAGELEPYGASADSLSGQSEFATRHFRRGNSTGIGGSFLQTTSPTSESSPAVTVTEQPLARQSQFTLPKLNSMFSQTSPNPALQSFTPSLPTMPRSSALIAPTLGAARFASENQSLEDLPSFSSRPSFMDKMQNTNNMNYWGGSYKP